MSTYMQKSHEVERKWYIIDASEKPLGRVAVQIADLLRGKHKPTFTPHVDCGDNVVVINCAKAVLTGKKLENKRRYRHTGYIGHIKTIEYKHLMAQKPEKAMEYAVKGMLPNTTLGRNQILRMHLYANNEHDKQAQKPQPWVSNKEDVRNV